MVIDTEKLLSTYRVAPSEQRALVAFPCDPTLNVGDEVQIVVDPRGNNWLLKHPDLTLHNICYDGQYVLVIEKPAEWTPQQMIDREG